MANVSQKQPHVVIVGAGFGGLKAAKTLRRAAARVTVVDLQNHHLFQPLLYQVATAALSPGDIAAPIRRVLRRQKNAEVVLAEARSVDVARKELILADGSISYDHLILATGATHSYFGNPEWTRLAPGLKTIEDALEIRRRILTAFERAERETDPAVQQAYLTFVVVGAGPTGVELAGALAEIARRTLPGDFRRIVPEKAAVILLELLPQVLPTYAPSLSEAARRQLEKLGVQVRTGTNVTAIDEDGVSIGDERISARTVLWGAGVAASPVGRTLGVPVDKAGRVAVNADLTVPGHPEIQAIGDLAALAIDGKPVPGVAPAAIQEGEHAAKNILRLLRGRGTLPFRYNDKGSLATIGRAAAVADIRGVKLTGFPAWMAWLMVHILFLVGFRNRLMVLLEWGWSYLTFERSARLITQTARQWRLLGSEPEAIPPDASQIRRESQPLPQASKDAGTPAQLH